ncbi:hypothetical protein [Nostoc sp.]|uniref:hypothetical protein n=1 Tax=Nostoc sp. TaxID=1180 RepID=UPI002FF505D3
MKVLVIFRTMRDRDRQKNNTGFAIAQKIIETQGGSITYKFTKQFYLNLTNLMVKTAQAYGTR